ncbi:unnamed protein product, partial [Mesorhabditis spiculigera]
MTNSGKSIGRKLVVSGRRQVVTENGELYHAENAEAELESTPFPSVVPSSESSEEIIRTKRSHTREHSLAPAKEINDGQQLTVGFINFAKRKCIPC